MQIFITGVSKGLGEALAKLYLNKGFDVCGIGRKSNIKHRKFSFMYCDLSHHDEVENLMLDFKSNTEILLINNAGIIGEIKRISDQEKDFSQELFQINTIAPIQLIRKFSLVSAEYKCKLTVLNISSGAGRRAIPSWANYCASKAALDLFSECYQIEEYEKNSGNKIFSLAPGVIDTEMQEVIRSSKAENFSSRDNFVQLKNENNLKSPNEVAELIVKSLEANLFESVVCRL